MSSDAQNENDYFTNQQIIGGRGTKSAAMLGNAAMKKQIYRTSSDFNTTKYHFTHGVNEG